MSNAAQTANTTISHLGGTGRLSAMINAKHFSYAEDGAVTFRFSGSRKFNYAKVSVDRATDTYTLKLMKIVKYETRAEDTAEGLYVSNLREAFERRTGLYLSL